MSIIEKAKLLAKVTYKDKHYNQKDFLYHLDQVHSLILIVAPDDENLRAATYLYSIIDNSKVTYQILVKDFNQDIADLVKENTSGWIKKSYPNLHSRRAIMIRFADRFANLANIDPWKMEEQDDYLKKSKFWK